MDMEFAAEIGQNLLVEVRRLQGLLTERDSALAKLQEEKEGWAVELKEMGQAMKAAQTTAGE